VAQTASYTEKAAAQTLSPTLTVLDVDNTTLAGATVRISAGAFADDVLAAATIGTSITASWNAANETLILSGNDTLAHYQQVLRTVTFSSSSGNPTDFGADTTRTIEWQINDGTLAAPLFQGQSPYMVPAAPTFVTVADLNGDGHADLVTANADANNVSILLSEWSGWLWHRDDICHGSGPMVGRGSRFRR
jgi:hypothetical protein